MTINDVDYAVEGMQLISRQGTVIPLEKGPDQDEFFLTFEVLGSSTNVVTEPLPLAGPYGLGADLIQHSISGVGHDRWN